MKNKMKVSTPTDREIVIMRDLDAARQMVWNAITKPEYLKRWMCGPPGWEMTVCEEDQRVGGAFHWAWIGPEGAAMSMRGVYREVTPPVRMVRTETFEFGCVPQSGEQLAKLELTEEGNRTKLTITVLYPSKEARDGAIASGMEKGMEAGYERLDELLTSMTTSQAKG